MRKGAYHGADGPVAVAGVTPLTTVDYPDRLAAGLFLPGCPWRCPYCHNPALQRVDTRSDWPWPRVRQFLMERRGFIEAIVFSGGEPTMHLGLPEALQEVRRMGYLTGLHTAGIYPDRLTAVLALLDWVGMDVKAPFDGRYIQVTGDETSVTKVQASLAALAASGVPYQLRTTIDGCVCGDTDYAELCRELSDRNVPQPVRQVARTPEPTVAGHGGPGRTRPTWVATTPDADRHCITEGARV